ncbi:MAG: hypothetical protein ACHQ53_11295 [Polyangiales bacterium]
MVGLVFRCLLSALLIAACSRTSHEEHRGPVEAPPRVGYGTAMTDVARRFELLGRAATAGRFELADYELGEIEEQFEDTLPHAAPPKEGHPEVLPAMASAFAKTNVQELRRALATRDRAQVATAFARTATACNGCHQASGHGFIEVPGVPGRGVPNTDPVAP